MRSELFEEAWKQNRHVWESTKCLAQAMYLAGEQHQQSKVDELQNNINLLTEALDIKEQLNQKLREREGELQKRVDDLTLALDQIAYPIPHMQKEAELNGCELNGYWAVKMSEDHTYSKDIARRALEKEQALKGGGE